MTNRSTPAFFSALFIIAAFVLTGCSNESVAQNETSNAVEASVTKISTNKTAPLQSAVTQHGEETHNSHCYKCHTDEVYKRDNRFVKSIDALSKQVVRCKDGTEAAWFDEDSEAVVQFLNQKYYKF